GVRMLRGARPRALGLAALFLVLMVPITVRAVPFTFTNGTVADATQVNANFASLQGIGPTSPTQLVDLWANAGPCPQGVSPQLYRALDLRLQSDGSQTVFSIPTGKALVLSDLSIIVFLGTSGAGHSVYVDVARVNATNFSIFEAKTAT